ncbi:MAG: sulfite exporter TauE/SafE family protein [Thermodesulfobacterium sp.]|nr:sulfite exporter TauE/SafE family protein [Thermodesulfobacterium sp.]
MIEFPFTITFPISGVTTSILIPPLVSFFIAFLCASGGVSGAFLLLPLQVSVLGFTTPSVSATNHLYNVFSIPFGVYRYWKEKRFFFPLTLVIILGTLPGVIVGYFLRILFFNELKKFKLLVGLVLLSIATRLVYEIFAVKKEIKFSFDPPQTLTFNWKKLKFAYSGKVFELNSFFITLLALFIGTIGGIYGIGGGALMAPILLAFFRLPAYVFAGATLAGTCITSIVGVIIFTLGGHQPDWLLGLFLGIGGALGLFFGARLQKYMPQKLIRIIITTGVLFIGYNYVTSFFKS